MSLSQEQPPISIDEELTEFLNRRFVDIGNELQQPSKFPQRKEMPYKPQTGDVHYFGNPATHNYDAQISAEGFWGLTSGGWLGLDSVSGGGAPITSVFGRTGAIVALQADYDAFFLTLAEGNANYLGITSKAVDSDLLDGIDSTGFLLVGGKAADSELLDGIDSTGFLLVGAKAADSELLDGIDILNIARTDIAETFNNTLTVSFDTLSQQLVIKPTSLTGQDAELDIRGARNSPAIGGQVASLLLSDFDNDITAVVELARITSEVVAIDTDLNELKLAFYYRDAGALVEGFHLYNGSAFFLEPIDVVGNITLSGTVDGIDVGVDVAANTSKLAGIEAGATADQTAAEIEAIVSHDNLIDFLTTEHFLQSAISITLSQVSDSGALAALATVGSAQIDDNSVGNAKLADMAQDIILGRVSAGSGNPQHLTPAQVTAMLDTFTSGLQGLAPSSGGGTVNFLRADGTWIAPAGSGGNVSSVGVPLDGQIAIWTTASTIEGDPDFTFDGLNLSIGGTVDGRDVAADGIVLDAVEAGRSWNDS